MIVKEVQFGTQEYTSLCQLREKELRIPLGKRLIPADVKGEDQQFHFGIFSEKKAIACLILAPKDGASVKMRQVCTASKFQGKGIGKQLLNYVEKWARARQFSEINCHARVSAATFYAKHGYRIEGDIFYEIGIPHYYMKKKLR